MKKYYALETSGMTADLYIFGDITSYPWKEKDKDAYSIVKELSELKADTINVHINSYGGEVSEGLAIHNCLKNSTAKIVTYCDGFACSAASVVFMAGDERIMNEASLLLIHNAWTYASGNAEEFRKQAEDLEKITQASVNAYMSRVNISEEELKKLMDDETWLTPEECLEYGFATDTMKEPETGVNQSAMKMIKDKILSTPAALEAVRTEINVEDIAAKIMEKITPLLKKEEEKPKDCTGFGAFFDSKKGEKNED